MRDLTSALSCKQRLMNDSFPAPGADRFTCVIFGDSVHLSAEFANLFLRICPTMRSGTSKATMPL
jgi:hypothetical protein